MQTRSLCAAYSAKMAQRHHRSFGDQARSAVSVTAPGLCQRSELANRMPDWSAHTTRPAELQRLPVARKLLRVPLSWACSSKGAEWRCLNPRPIAAPRVARACLRNPFWSKMYSGFYFNLTSSPRISVARSLLCLHLWKNKLPRVSV